MNITPKNIQALGLNPATKKPSLKKEVFLNGPLTQCTLLPSPYFLALLFLQDQKQCLYLLLILILACGYIISVQRKKILKLYMEINNYWKKATTIAIISKAHADIVLITCGLAFNHIDIFSAAAP